MVQKSSSGDMGLSFKNAIKAAADRTRTGTVRPPAADETIAKLTSNQGRFGVPPKVVQDMMAGEEKGDVPEGPHEG